MTENNRYQHWQLKRDAEGIAWLALDRQGEKVNSLSSEVLLELDNLLAELEAEIGRAHV